MTDDRERPAAGWRKEEMRIDDGEGDPLPPVGDLSTESDDAEDETVHVDAVVVDPITGDVVAAHVEAIGADETADRDEDAAGWNKEQMAIEREGETPRRMDPDAMPESEEGMTGGRSNPGGGEQFGEFDDAGRRKP